MPRNQRFALIGIAVVIAAGAFVIARRIARPAVEPS